MTNVCGVEGHHKFKSWTVDGDVICRKRLVQGETPCAESPLCLTWSLCSAPRVLNETGPSDLLVIRAFWWDCDQTTGKNS